MKKQPVVKAPRQKSLAIRLRPDQIKTILTSVAALMMATMAEDSENVPVGTLREAANPAYKEIASELGRFTTREVKPGKLFGLSVEMFPVHGYFHIFFTHDDGSHEMGQSWRIAVNHPSGRTRFQHRVEALGGLDAAVKESKKL